MNDWAKEAAQRLRAAEQARMESQQGPEEELRKLKSCAPRLWVSLSDSIESRCQSLAVEMGTPVLETSLSPPSGIIVKKLAPPAALTVNFIRDPYRVSYSCGRGRGEYRIRVDADGNASFCDAYNRWFTVEAVATNLLDLLLRSPF